jgi:hypothetical protein
MFPSVSLMAKFLSSSESSGLSESLSILYHFIGLLSKFR